MNCDELQTLTALEALGVLEETERASLQARLEQDPAARADLARFFDVAGALAWLVPPARPSASVRERVLERIRQRPQLAAKSPEPQAPSAGAAKLLPEGIQFVMADAPWLPSPLPNSRFKLLSAGPHQDYIVLLIELGPGAKYPEHDHDGPEEMLVLSGDLQSEGRSLGPGDFLHAEPGSHHHELSSIDGCRALMVVPKSALAELGQV